MSINLSDTDLAEAGMLLSSERLANYQAKAGTMSGALELHRLAMQLSGSLLAAIGVVEIALRNASNENLTALFQRPNWLQNPPPLVVWREYEQRSIEKALKSARKAAYASMDYGEKKALDAIASPPGQSRRGKTAHLDQAKRRQDAIIVTEGQVIAQLTFGFWKGIYAAEYDMILWRRSLRRIFPNKSTTRASIAINLEIIYQTRNRIAHHESVTGRRVADVKGAIDFIASHMMAVAPTPATPLAKLLAPHLALVDVHAAEFDACLASFTVSGGTTAV